MAKITAILFDKDGTLFDFHRSWGDWARRLLADLAEGVPARETALAEAIGYDLGGMRFRGDSPVIAGTPDEVVELMLPHLPGLGPTGLLARINAAAARAEMVPAVPLAPLFDALADRGLALGVATNDAEAPARAHLEAAGIAQRLDFVAGCDSGFGAKPDPGPLRAFARETGRRPEEVLMVGDSRHDLAAGRAAGMGTVGVLTGLATAADLADLADATLPDIGHLPVHIDGLHP